MPAVYPDYAPEVEVLVEEDFDLRYHLSDLVDNDSAAIIVYNDEVNTFEWVIQCFQEILWHASDQAEQLSIIIHYKGKASVKTGRFEVLKPLKEALCDRGLSAVIEDVSAR